MFTHQAEIPGFYQGKANELKRSANPLRLPKAEREPDYRWNIGDERNLTVDDFLARQRIMGLLIVKDGVIVGRGWTQPGGRPHAEVEALRQAKKAAQGATLYATLEPCSHLGKSPPCADAIIKAGITRVVASIEDPNPEVAGQGFEKLRAKGIAVDVGLFADEARHVRLFQFAKHYFRELRRCHP